MSRLFSRFAMALLVTGIWTGALTLGIFACTAHAGDCPRYLILQPAYGGQGHCVQARAYAYGWFGAIPSSESTGHMAYHRTLYTWTYVPGY
jgi:hypothetical protein